MTFSWRFFPRLMLWAVAACLGLPIVTIFLAWVQADGASTTILWHLAHTVLPNYLGASGWLCLLVSVGVVSMGSVSAVAITLFDFPGRRTLEWALLLPLAMPAYVVAYAYTDFLQYSGPLQTWLRHTWGLEGRVLPDIRSLGGAAMVFTLALYPYVYLLARTALSARANHLMEAARLLGVPLWQRIVKVALPLARPAVAAGTTLALMETLADFGVCSYFGIQTFTSGIYKAWLVMDNRIAAAQLSTVLLLLVVALLLVEQRAQARMRFVTSKSNHQSMESQPLRLQGAGAAAALTLCLLPVLFGFVVPVGLMLHALWVNAQSTPIPWKPLAQWVINSLSLGTVTAGLALLVAGLLVAKVRLQPTPAWRWMVRMVSLGYAVPGAVIVVGLLLPLGWLQATWPSSNMGYWITATPLGLLWAYLVRFVAVALQSLQSGYAQIPQSLDESARMLGISGTRLLARVHTPLLRKSAAAAALLVFVDVIKELPATLVLRPFNTDTLAVMIYQLARDERLGDAALPSLVLVLLSLPAVVLLGRASLPNASAMASLPQRH